MRDYEMIKQTVSKIFSVVFVFLFSYLSVFLSVRVFVINSMLRYCSLSWLL